MTSKTTFESLKLRPEISEKLSKSGFRDMTPVQAKTIPYALQRKDLIVQSQTGSGKTLAYLVPLAQLLRNPRSTEMHALIIVPTRELCMQIKEAADILGLKSEIFIGGTPIGEDSARLGTAVCIATPGRLLELMTQDIKAFKGVYHLVLDESDKLLDFGFESKLLAIIGMLPKKRVTGLFSATISDAVTKLSLHSLCNPVTVKVTTGIPDKLKLMYLVTSPHRKLDFFLKLTKDKRSIVFFATCVEVEFFYTLLNSYYGQGSNENIDVH
ncbi:ATP-dependent RNA helicase DDX55/SPB4, partial [Pancytospora epiphaga]